MLIMSTVRLYHFEPVVRVLGPGLRAAVWFQGCPFRCPRCIAPGTHDPSGGVEVDTRELAARIHGIDSIEGVTISGGEPFMQEDSLYALIDAIKSGRPDLSVMLYTGYYLGELQTRFPMMVSRILPMVDILVDGRFEYSKRCNNPWTGSWNQHVHFTSDTYSLEDCKSCMDETVELFVQENGHVFMAGIPGESDFSAFEERLRRRGILIKSGA